jgi:hypothetical protein
MSPRWGSTPRQTDWLTDWLIDHQSQYDFDSDLARESVGATRTSWQHLETHGKSDPPTSKVANQFWKQLPWPLGSPPPALATLQLACSHTATKHRGPPSLMQASLWPELRWHSLWIYMVVAPNTRTDIPHIYKLVLWSKQRGLVCVRDFNTELDLSVR